MSPLPVEAFQAWLDSRRAGVRRDAPGALSDRRRLDDVLALHRADPTGSWCVHCQWTWPCRTFTSAGGGA